MLGIRAWKKLTESQAVSPKALRHYGPITLTQSTPEYMAKSYDALVEKGLAVKTIGPGPNYSARYTLPETVA